MQAEKTRELSGEFVRFFVVGVGATLVHLGVYLLLNEMFGVGESAPLALTLTYTTGYIVSFVCNYLVSLKWTFRTRGSMKKGLGFAFSHAVNAGMHLLLLNLFRVLGAGTVLVSLFQTMCPWLIELLPVLGRPESLLPFPVYAIVVPINFLMVRYFLKK